MNIDLYNQLVVEKDYYAWVNFLSTCLAIFSLYYFARVFYFFARVKNKAQLIQRDNIVAHILNILSVLGFCGTVFVEGSYSNYLEYESLRMLLKGIQFLCMAFTARYSYRFFHYLIERYIKHDENYKIL